MLGLARALGASVRTLHRYLQRASGETPKHFIERIRFEAARTQLETTAHTVKRLAASAGYADEASFRRAFSRYSGMTPSAYRRWVQARQK
ncbi:helix-turn-helix domain-containing protein [Methylocystis sp.]|uniref:helix-turn-helix domain-containing protein n=1 Tax=Methylocystis sp. TaxID=1911079 RepID=UPI003DA5FC04